MMAKVVGDGVGAVGLVGLPRPPDVQPAATKAETATTERNEVRPLPDEIHDEMPIGFSHNVGDQDLVAA